MDGADGFIDAPDVQRGADGLPSSSHEEAGSSASPGAQGQETKERQSGRKRARKPSSVARRGSGRGAVPRSHAPEASSDSTDASDGFTGVCPSVLVAGHASPRVLELMVSIPPAACASVHVSALRTQRHCPLRLCPTIVRLCG